MGSNCEQYFVVEANGDVFPCDFFVQKTLKLGNVEEYSWEKLLSLKKFHFFGENKKNWNAECSTCPFLNLCHGDCQKHRFSAHLSNSTNLSALCRGWKKFYAHSLPEFIKIAQNVKQEQKITTSFSLQTIKFSRNASCPCGSGKKYKMCCLK